MVSPAAASDPLSAGDAHSASSSDSPPPSTGGRRPDAGGAVAAESGQSRSERASGVARKVKGPILKRARRAAIARASSSSSSSSGLKGTVRIEDLALPLGMSVAAVIARVVDKANSLGENISVDRLSLICISAIGESMSTVLGDSINSFMRNFEISFSSTLKTLLLINEASIRARISGIKIECSKEASCLTSQVQPGCLGVDSSNGSEEMQETILASDIFNELTLHGQMNQPLSLSSRSTSTAYSQPVISTFERSVSEQTRSNNLKTLELALNLQRLNLKRSHLALHSQANWLERIKISMGISKTTFREEKLKMQILETRHAELLKKCIDCLVTGLLVMTASLLYGTYVYSFERLTEATASCTPSKVFASWMIPNPMASITSGFYLLRCHATIFSRMAFGLLMIWAVAYSLLRRSANTKQAMPITFILLLLGIACGIAGKVCVDTLGGSGYCWLFYWELLCLVHFLANILPSVLLKILDGPVPVYSGAPESKSWVPCYPRKVVFYSVVLFVLPVLCGLMPFASLKEWWKHFLPLSGAVT